MNFLDILILVPLLYAAWKGYLKGLIIEIFTLLALLVGIYCAVQFSELLTEKLVEQVPGEPSYVPIVSFSLIFLAVGAMIYFAGKAVEKVIKIAQLSLFNKLAGGFFSLAKMAYIVSILLVIWTSYDLNHKLVSKETKEKSLLFIPLKKMSIATIPALRESRFVQQSDSTDLALTAADSLRKTQLTDSLAHLKVR